MIKKPDHAGRIIILLFPVILSFSCLSEPLKKGMVLDPADYVMETGEGPVRQLDFRLAEKYKSEWVTKSDDIGLPYREEKSFSYDGELIIEGNRTTFSLREQQLIAAAEYKNRIYLLISGYSFSHDFFWYQLKQNGTVENVPCGQIPEDLLLVKFRDHESGEYYLSGMLRLIWACDPGKSIDLFEKCSGHHGYFENNHDYEEGCYKFDSPLKSYLDLILEYSGDPDKTRLLDIAKTVLYNCDPVKNLNDAAAVGLFMIDLDIVKGRKIIEDYLKAGGYPELKPDQFNPSNCYPRDLEKLLNRIDLLNLQDDPLYSGFLELCAQHGYKHSRYWNGPDDYSRADISKFEDYFSVTEPDIDIGINKILFGYINNNGNPYLEIKAYKSVLDYKMLTLNGNYISVQFDISHDESVEIIKNRKIPEKYFAEIADCYKNL